MSYVLMRAEGIDKFFGGVQALLGVDLEIRRDEILGVIGPNGAGKTTLFNVLTGFSRPTRGKVFFDNQDVTGKPVYVVCQKGIGRTFQNIRLFGQMTVIDNVVVGMHNRLHMHLLGITLRLPSTMRKEREAYDKAGRILEYLGLGDVTWELAANLPYGRQRKVEIARALASEPKLILLDEPSAGMNPQEATDLMTLISGIRKMGPSVVVIEHNMQVVMGISDRVAVLDFGKKICEGTPEEVRNDEGVIEAYLGREEDTGAA
jgi:branched-chain amino acid transport system ATP-binding protein